MERWREGSAIKNFLQRILAFSYRRLGPSAVKPPRPTDNSTAMGEQGFALLVARIHMLQSNMHHRVR